VGHQDMASAGARAYNGGLGAEPPAGFRARAPGQGAEPLVRRSGGFRRPPSPEAESLFAFGRLIVQYFAVFVRFSGDSCTTLHEIEITCNQQEIGVSEGNVKGQGIKIPDIARIHPWQIRLRQSGCHRSCSSTAVI